MLERKILCQFWQACHFLFRFVLGKEKPKFSPWPLGLAVLGESKRGLDIVRKRQSMDQSHARLDKGGVQLHQWPPFQQGLASQYGRGWRQQGSPATVPHSMFQPPVLRERERVGLCM